MKKPAIDDLDHQLRGGLELAAAFWAFTSKAGFYSKEACEAAAESIEFNTKDDEDLQIRALGAVAVRFLRGEDV